MVRSEATEIYENTDASAQSVAFKSSSGEDAMPGGKLYWLVGVSFGLLCVLQAILNISLRLIPYSETPDIQTCDKNLTEERDQLRRMLNNIDQHSQKGWLYFNHRLYYVSSTRKTWQDSRYDCLGRDADLVIINSIAEQEFTRQFTKIMWIGMTDSETEGIWKWVDGTPLTTSYWGHEEPNSDQGKNEDCGEIRFYNLENSWNDKSCKTENFWICEKAVAP